VKGTTDWTEYRLRHLQAPVRDLWPWLFALFGTAKVWFDDLELLVDGKPIADTP